METVNTSHEHTRRGVFTLYKPIKGLSPITPPADTHQSISTETTLRILLTSSPILYSSGTLSPPLNSQSDLFHNNPADTTKNRLTLDLTSFPSPPNVSAPATGRHHELHLQRDTFTPTECFSSERQTQTGESGVTPVRSRVNVYRKSTQNSEFFFRTR